MFDLLLERRVEDRRQTVGLLAATIVNTAPFGGKREATSPYDFFPDQRRREETARVIRWQTPEDHEKILTAIFQRPPEKAA